MRGFISKIFLFICVFSILACSPPQIQKFNNEIALSYANTEALFFDAAVKGDIILVMRLVEEKIVDVNIRDRFGWTGWMYAARYGHEGRWKGSTHSSMSRPESRS